MSAKPGEIYSHFASKFSTPIEGALRVWWIPQIPGKQFEWPVNSTDEAAMLLDALAAYDDFQFSQRVKGDYSNTGGLLRFEGGEWVDWEDDECDEFDAWREKQKETPGTAEK
jgi:hypothetical protein